MWAAKFQCLLYKHVTSVIQTSDSEDSSAQLYSCSKKLIHIKMTSIIYHNRSLDLICARTKVYSCASLVSTTQYSTTTALTTSLFKKSPQLVIVKPK